MQPQGTNFMMGFIAVLALVGFYVLTTPDMSRSDEKTGDAIRDAADGLKRSSKE